MSYLKWTPDEQIIGFRSMEKIDPVRVVGRGPNVSVLPRAVYQLSPRWNWDGQSMDIDGYMAAMRTSGVIVLKDGQIVLERYGLGRSETDRWLSESMAKSVTSILVGAAIQEGSINGTDALVTDHLPELKDGGYAGVTIGHLLTMSSGVKWNDDFADPESDFNKLWSHVPEAGLNPFVSYLRRQPRADRPGTSFNYKTVETHLAGILLARATGKSMAEYLSEKVWSPCGMELDAYWKVDHADHELGGSGISASLRDYARIGQFMLSGGKAGSTQVLSPAWLAKATSAQVTFPAESGPDGADGYGYFWWIHKDAYAARGHFGQGIYIYPDDQVVVAINSAWPAVTPSDAWQCQFRFVEALREAAATSA